MLVANFAQTLEITLRWHQYASGTGHRLDKHGCDVRRIMQLDQLEQLIGQGNTTLLRHAPGEGVAGQQGVRQMVDIHHRLAKQLTVTVHTAQAGTSNVHTVVTTGSTNHLGLGGLTFEAPVGPHHLHCRIGTFRARIGEEHMIQVAWGQVGDLFRQLEGQRMTVLKAWGVVQGAQLLGDRFLDFLARMPGATGPQARQRIIDLAPLVIGQPATFGGHDQAWIALEVAVGGVRHPVRIQLQLAGQGRWGVFGHVHQQNLAGQKAASGLKKRCCS